MRKYTKEELNQILEDHNRWLYDVKTGKRANLSGAKINRCVGDGKIIKNIIGLRWHISITKDIIAIGCEQHSVEDWKNFDDNMISSMGDNALEFWRENKGKILNMFEF